MSVIHDEGPKLNGWKIVREMVRHIWPREHPTLKVRVVTALSLLVGAKVRQVVLVSVCNNLILIRNNPFSFLTYYIKHAPRLYTT